MAKGEKHSSHDNAGGKGHLDTLSRREQCANYATA
jgi:hypothetical protein